MEHNFTLVMLLNKKKQNMFSPLVLSPSKKHGIEVPGLFPLATTAPAVIELSPLLRFCEIRLFFLFFLNRLKYPFNASVKPLLRLYGSFLETDVFPFGLFSLLSFSLSNFNIHGNAPTFYPSRADKKGRQ